MPTIQPFDAVLFIAFGGPERPHEVRPFIQSVLAGREVPQERIEQAAARYEAIGGASPFATITHRQADGLRERLRQAGVDLPVHVGMRHSHPRLPHAFQALAAQGARRVLAFIANPHHSFVSCTLYKRAVEHARLHLTDQGGPDVSVTYVDSWFDHPMFIAASAARVGEALERLAPKDRGCARLILSAHALPVSMARECCYCQQAEQTAQQIAELLGGLDWAVVYQSRPHPTREPWLEPDVCDYLKDEHAKGLRAAILAPLGFVADNMEVLYDLHRVAGGLCRELDLPAAAAHTVNDHPLFLDMSADLVVRACRRFARFDPLPIVGAEPLHEAVTMRRSPSQPR